LKNKSWLAASISWDAAGRQATGGSPTAIHEFSPGAVLHCWLLLLVFPPANDPAGCKAAVDDNKHDVPAAFTSKACKAQCLQLFELPNPRRKCTVQQVSVHEQQLQINQVAQCLWQCAVDQVLCCSNAALHSIDLKHQPLLLTQQPAGHLSLFSATGRARAMLCVQICDATGVCFCAAQMMPWDVWPALSADREAACSIHAKGGALAASNITVRHHHVAFCSE